MVWNGECLECGPSTAFSMSPAWISDGREGKGPRAMSLVVKEWSQPIRPISKGGGAVRHFQKVGTSPKGGDVATDCGDVPTFSVHESAHEQFMNRTSCS